MDAGPPLALLFAAALTDAGLLLIVIAGGAAIVAFLLFVLREALSHPVDGPRELPPPHDLPPMRAGDGSDPTAATRDIPDPPSATGGLASTPTRDRTP
jgi:hypothetical protein